MKLRRHVQPITTNRSFILAQSLYRLHMHFINLGYLWFDGQRGRETPGPIPNPAVKLTCVIFGTMVREPMGKLPSPRAGDSSLGGELQLTSSEVFGSKLHCLKAS